MFSRTQRHEPRSCSTTSAPATWGGMRDSPCAQSHELMSDENSTTYRSLFASGREQYPPSLQQVPCGHSVCGVFDVASGKPADGLAFVGVPVVASPPVYGHLYSPPSSCQLRAAAAAPYGTFLSSSMRVS